MMGLTQWLTQSWRQIKARDQGILFELHPAGPFMLSQIVAALSRYGQGRLLDIGGGRLPYIRHLPDTVDSYVSLDFTCSDPRLSVQGDAQRLPFDDEVFDTVFSAQVFEHLPEPWVATEEAFRVLKPGGHIIISIPHMMYLHQEPYDFYRFTKYGLIFLLERAGFRVVEIKPMGGYVAFTAFLPIIVFAPVVYGIPLLRSVGFSCLKFLARAVGWMDAHVDQRKAMAFTYLAVGEKPWAARS